VLLMPADALVMEKANAFAYTVKEVQRRNSPLRSASGKISRLSRICRRRAAIL
jgi:hypothetical protein